MCECLSERFVCSSAFSVLDIVSPFMICSGSRGREGETFEETVNGDSCWLQACCWQPASTTMRRSSIMVFGIIALDGPFLREMVGSELSPVTAALREFSSDRDHNFWR